MGDLPGIGRPARHNVEPANHLQDGQGRVNVTRPFKAIVNAIERFGHQVAEPIFGMLPDIPACSVQGGQRLGHFRDHLAGFDVDECGTV